MMQKKNTVFKTLSHITASTWNSSIKHFQLLYTAVIQFTMLYNLQMWDLWNDDAFSVTFLLKFLKNIQNWYLHRVIKVYKRISTITLKQKSEIQLMNLHMKHKIMQRNLKTTDHSVFTEISWVINIIWTFLQRSVSKVQTKHK